MSGGKAAGNPRFQVCTNANKQVRFPINADHDRWGYYRGDNAAPAGSMKTMLLNNLPFGSLHPGGANFCLVDASVHFLSDDLDFTVFEDFATTAGAEINGGTR